MKKFDVTDIEKNVYPSGLEDVGAGEFCLEQTRFYVKHERYSETDIERVLINEDALRIIADAMGFTIRENASPDDPIFDFIGYNVDDDEAVTTDYTIRERFGITSHNLQTGFKIEKRHPCEHLTGSREWCLWLERQVKRLAEKL